MNDIRPPKRPDSSMPQQPRPNQPYVTGQIPTVQSGVTQTPLVDQRPVTTAAPANDSSQSPVNTPPAHSSKQKTPLYRRKWLMATVVLGLLVLLLVVAGYAFYRHQLSPVSSSDRAETVAVEIPSGSTPDQIASLLKQKSLIRNTLAFEAYTRLHGVRNQLLAGTYRLSPQESTPQIVQHLVDGQVNEFKVTFYPGSALSSSAPNDSTPSHKKVLESLGYSEEEINAAFTAQYDHPLLASKPEDADLEGYIYGETYQVASGSTVEQILEKTFDEYYAQLVDKGLINSIKTQGKTLHEVITLASIVQRESGGDNDKAQIAQVFLSRLEKGMNLGSDVTYQYIADKQGVARDVNLDSPYNTRRYGGLPPGPISSPTIKSIDAVVNPAEGDDLYFLSGDDDVTYYARTEEEHNKNIDDHCQLKCDIL